MTEETSNTNPSSREHGKEMLVNQIIDLQYLATRRDLTVRRYTADELNSLDASELKLLRSHLHELLYAPPAK